MEHDAKNIYQITPHNKSKHKTMLAFSNTPEEARNAASRIINLLKEISPGGEIPLIDPVYIDEKLSDCKKINVEIILNEKNSYIFDTKDMNII